MMKRISSLLLALCILLSYTPSALASDATIGGDCGTNLTWSLSNGELTVTGTGDMDNYEFGTAPWFRHCTEIRSIVINDGVTSVGNYAFYNCWLAETVSLPDSLTAIGNMAFACCDRFKTVVFPANIKFIDTSAFASCSQLTEIYFRGDAPVILEDAFLYCLGTVYYPIGNATWKEEIFAASGGSFSLTEYCVKHVSALIPAIDPTCTEDGLTQGAYCSLCRKTLITPLTVPAKGHTYTTIASEEATCTGYGMTEGFYCVVCNVIFVEQQIVPPTGHEYSKIVTLPTCTEQGYITNVCTKCGDTYRSNVTPALEHSTVIDPAVAPTCSSTGLTAGEHCTRCHEVTEPQATIPKLEHTWDNGTVTVAPTYESMGTKTYTCPECGETKTAVIPELGHVHKYTAVITPPTCVTDGYTTYTCYCTDSYIADLIQSPGHDPLDAVQEECIPAGCETEGTHDSVVYCARCSEELSRISVSTPATGHSIVTTPAVAASCTEGGSSEGTACSTCGKIFAIPEDIPPTGHTLVKDKAVAVTCTTPGYTAGAHCYVCGKVLIARQTIEAIGHIPGEPVIENEDAAAGCYDIVIYCTVCSAEISRETVGGYTHEHIPAPATTENAVAATCMAAGSYEEVVRCTECGIALSRTMHTTAALPHTPGIAVVENKVNAGELTEGSYDSVIYCTVCETELSRETKIIPATGIDPLTITRIYGADRSKTAIQAADTLKSELGIDKFESIIIASGSNFADALAGSYFAAVNSAPILLYQANATEMNHRYILDNLSEGGTVYLLGGSAAVPETIETLLLDASIHTVRLAGSDRYATCIKILEEAGIPDDQELLIATGKNFADSLSASATGLPILLVNGTKETLTGSQISFLEDHAVSGLTILGGDAAVSDGLKSQLSGFGKVSRIYGSTRFETSVKIAEAYFNNVDTAFIAYGYNFPDGLCGGPVAYTMYAPMLLTAEGEEAIASSYIEKQSVQAGYVMGGSSVISDETVNKIFYSD